MKVKYLILPLSLFILILFSACNGTEEQNEDVQQNNATTIEIENLTIYTTTFVLEDFIKKIGGEKIDVINLVPPGADAHTFEPTAKQILEVLKSDGFIYNGAGFEGFADSIIKTIEKENVNTLQASKNIPLLMENEEIHEDEHEHVHSEDEHKEHVEDSGVDEHVHDIDPHAWIDPVYALIYIENIYSFLVELEPAFTEEFTNNFNSLQNELKELHNNFEEMVFSAKRNEFIVSHAAYGYWEQRYGLKQISISGLSPTNEPSQQKIIEIIELGELYNLTSIFVEQNFTPTVVDIIASELDSSIIQLHNLESATVEDIENGEDYLSIMYRNIESLKQGLN